MSLRGNGDIGQITFSPQSFDHVFFPAGTLEVHLKRNLTDFKGTRSFQNEDPEVRGRECNESRTDEMSNSGMIGNGDSRGCAPGSRKVSLRRKLGFKCALDMHSTGSCFEPRCRTIRTSGKRASNLVLSTQFVMQVVTAGYFRVPWPFVLKSMAVGYSW